MNSVKSTLTQAKHLLANFLHEVILSKIWGTGDIFFSPDLNLQDLALESYKWPVLIFSKALS